MMMMIISSWWWGGGGDEISPKFHNLAYHTYWIEHWCSDKPLSEQQVLIRIYIFAWPYHVSIFCSEEFSLKCPFFFTCHLDLSVHQKDHNYCHMACQGGWWTPLRLHIVRGKIQCWKLEKQKRESQVGSHLSMPNCLAHSSSYVQPGLRPTCIAKNFQRFLTVSSSASASTLNHTGRFFT